MVFKKGRIVSLFLALALVLSVAPPLYAGAATEIKDVGEVTVITSSKEKPVEGKRGVFTLPGGGTIQVGLVVIEAPIATVIDKDGMLTIGKGKARVTLKSRAVVNLEPGAIVLLDEDKPLGYTMVPKDQFGDVKSGDWFYESVSFAASHGLFGGTGKNVFSPNESMTRAMLLTVLYRLAGEPYAPVDGNTFSDVAANDYFARAVSWAYQKDMITGSDDGKFAPHAKITREEMAVILSRYMRSEGINPITTSQYIIFRDEDDISQYAKPAIQELYKLGVMQGSDKGDINPKGAASRAEVATMLHRFVERAVAPKR